MSKSYIKLKAVGDAATFTVVRCAPGNGQYPDVEFEDSEGRVYAVPKASADKQLDRLNFPEYGDVVGRAITISRGENKKAPDKPFWNIDLASGAKQGNGSGPASAGKAGASTSGGGVATPLPPQPPTQPANGKEKDSALYLRMTEFVLTDVQKLYEDAGIPMDAAVVASCTATLYINAKGR